MKNIIILIAILFTGVLYSCNDKLVGSGPILGLNPKYTSFNNRSDTAIVTAQRSGFNISGRFVSGNAYICHTMDTLYGGWIKIVTLSDLKQIKIIVSDNYTGDARYYIVSINGRNNGEYINIFQSAD